MLVVSPIAFLSSSILNCSNSCLSRFSSASSLNNLLYISSNSCNFLLYKGALQEIENIVQLPGSYM